VFLFVYFNFYIYRARFSVSAYLLSIIRPIFLSQSNLLLSSLMC